MVFPWGCGRGGVGKVIFRAAGRNSLSPRVAATGREIPVRQSHGRGARHRTCRFPARWCSAAPIRRGLIPHRGVENILGIACVFAVGGPESSKGCVSTAPLRRATGGLTRDPVPSTVPGFDRRRTPLARLSAIKWPSKARLFQVAKLGSLRRPSDFRGNNTFVAVDVHRVSVLICAYTGKEVVG